MVFSEGKHKRQSNESQGEARCVWLWSLEDRRKEKVRGDRGSKGRRKKLDKTISIKDTLN